MTSESRAYVALVSGKLAQQRQGGAVNGMGEGRKYTYTDGQGSFVPTAPKRSCGVERDVNAVNYCLRDPAGRDHICLSLYGRLFEGFDHASATHFNGFVDGAEITLYDFAESAFFSYDLVEA